MVQDMSDKDDPDLDVAGFMRGRGGLIGVILLGALAVGAVVRMLG